MPAGINPNIGSAEEAISDAYRNRSNQRFPIYAVDLYDYRYGTGVVLYALQPPVGRINRGVIAMLNWADVIRFAENANPEPDRREEKNASRMASHSDAGAICRYQGERY